MCFIWSSGRSRKRVNRIIRSARSSTSSPGICPSVPARLSRREGRSQTGPYNGNRAASKESGRVAEAPLPTGTRHRRSPAPRSGPFPNPGRLEHNLTARRDGGPQRHEASPLHEADSTARSMPRTAHRTCDKLTDSKETLMPENKSRREFLSGATRVTGASVLGRPDAAACPCGGEQHHPVRPGRLRRPGHRRRGERARRSRTVPSSSSRWPTSSPPSSPIATAGCGSASPRRWTFPEDRKFIGFDAYRKAHRLPEARRRRGPRNASRFSLGTVLLRHRQRPERLHGEAASRSTAPPPAAC